MATLFAVSRVFAYTSFYSCEQTPLLSQVYVESVFAPGEFATNKRFARLLLVEQPITRKYSKKYTASLLDIHLRSFFTIERIIKRKISGTAAVILR